MSDPWHEPARGGYPDSAALLLSGREQLQSMLDGRTPQPPISRLTGMRLTDVGHGTAQFDMPLTGWLRSPQGAIPMGPLVMPADAAMACAIQTVLPAGTLFSTSELTLRLLAPARVGSTAAVRGELIQMRQTIGLASASVIDEDQRLIAHGSTLCVTLPALADGDGAAPGSAGPPTPERDAVLEPSTQVPDPWQRPAPGETLPQDVWDRLSGLEVLRAQLAGELPAPPIHHLTGLTLTAADPSHVTFDMPASEWLCAPPRGRVQGGGIALLGESALNAAIQTTAPAGTAVAPIDLKVNYLRPLAADGRRATGSGTVLHAGRRIAVASSEIRDADGRLVALATGSAMILPGRPASLGAAEA